MQPIWVEKSPRRELFGGRWQPWIRIAVRASGLASKMRTDLKEGRAGRGNRRPNTPSRASSWS